MLALCSGGRRRETWPLAERGPPRGSCRLHTSPCRCRSSRGGRGGAMLPVAWSSMQPMTRRLACHARARWLRHWRGSAPRGGSASRSTCALRKQDGEESDFACSLSFLVPHKHGGSGWRQPPNPSWLTAAVALTPCTASSRRRRADWLLQLWNGIAIAGIPCSVGLCARF